MNKHYTYEIVNDFDGSVYVGETANPDGRWADHMKVATNPLYVAMARAGADRFRFRVTQEFDDEADALVAEKQRIQELRQKGASVYNRDRLVGYEQPKPETVKVVDGRYACASTMASRWSVGRKTIYNWVRMGMPHFVVGTDIRIPVDQADAWVRAGGMNKKRVTRARRPQ